MATLPAPERTSGLFETRGNMKGAKIRLRKVGKKLTDSLFLFYFYVSFVHWMSQQIITALCCCSVCLCVRQLCSTSLSFSEQMSPCCWNAFWYTLTQTHAHVTWTYRTTAWFSHSSGARKHTGVHVRLPVNRHEYYIQLSWLCLCVLLLIHLPVWFFLLSCSSSIMKHNTLIQ